MSLQRLARCLRDSTDPQVREVREANPPVDGSSLNERRQFINFGLGLFSVPRRLVNRSFLCSFFQNNGSSCDRIESIDITYLQYFETMGTLTEVFSNFLLFFLVFSMSATVDIDKLRKQLSNKHALLTGVSLQFLILPFVGFLVVTIFQFPAPVGITLLVVTSSPGGSYSNWYVLLRQEVVHTTM